MRTGIGIDTGGTYTDAVIYSFHDQEIICSAKALTTKEDLSIGIKNALDGLDDTLLHQVDIVSLSTTLATNACVENKGGRAKLLFIAVDKETVQWVGSESGLSDPDAIYYVDAKASTDGHIITSPDWEAFFAQSRQWFQGVDALGIVELHAMSTGAALEKEARALISEKYNVPIICGHELFHDLNSIRRGASILLNGRLIPVLAGFLSSIKQALQERGVTAPVTIVRSDGSLMSERFTGARPVETILCGPAASVIGAHALVNEQQAVIVDMGGTTTDIALTRDGAPVKAKDGIHIGHWRTFVKGIYVETIGLGGDSAIRHDQSGSLKMEAMRVVPLSMAASRWPDITAKLQDLLNAKEKHSLLLHEFFVRLKDISNSPQYSEEEKRFCEALGSGPLIYTDAAAAMGKDIYSFKTERLEKESVIMRCGLTPTDIMHLKGDFSKYSLEAAELGARFVANCVGMDVPALCASVYDNVKKKLYNNIAGILLKEDMPRFYKAGFGNEVDSLINRAWEMSQGENAGRVRFGFATPSVLIGVGAPIHIFLPDVARALGTGCVIPPLASVVNAVGAVAGNITASCEIRIRPKSDGFIVYGIAEKFVVEEQGEAIAIACQEAEAGAREEALRRGAAGDIVVSFEEKPIIVKTGYNTDYFVEGKVIATAVGKIKL